MNEQGPRGLSRVCRPFRHSVLSRPDCCLLPAKVVSFNLLSRGPEVLSGKKDAYERTARGGPDAEGLL